MTHLLLATLRVANDTTEGHFCAAQEAIPKSADATTQLKIVHTKWCTQDLFNKNYIQIEASLHSFSAALHRALNANVRKTNCVQQLRKYKAVGLVCGTFHASKVGDHVKLLEIDLELISARCSEWLLAMLIVALFAPK